MFGDLESMYFKKKSRSWKLDEFIKKNCLNLNRDKIKHFRAKRDPNEWVTHGM